MTDEWSEDKCLLLIQEFRARPMLWDPNNKFYFKKNMKSGHWHEIADILNTPAVDCKHKMSILMSSFRREKAKIMHSLKRTSDPSKAYISSWFAFKEMAFLLDRKGDGKRTYAPKWDWRADLCMNKYESWDSDQEADEDEESASIKLALLSQHLEKVGKKPKFQKTAKNDDTPKVVRTQETESRIAQIEVTPAPVPTQTPEERDEEIKSFTSFIGNKMKKYTDTTKNAVQQAICEIIFKADQNCYETQSYEKFTIIDTNTDPLHKQGYGEDLQILKIQPDSDSD